MIVRHNPRLYIFDMQKAFTIQCMTTASDELRHSVTDAVKLAPVATSFAAEHILKWAFSFFADIGGSQQNIDAEFVTHDL